MYAIFSDRTGLRWSVVGQNLNPTESSGWFEPQAKDGSHQMVPDRNVAAGEGDRYVRKMLD